MNISLTPIFISTLSFFYIFLAMRVGYMRGSPVMKLFFKMDKEVTEEKVKLLKLNLVIHHLCKI